jgi:hypothetical protein
MTELQQNNILPPEPPSHEEEVRSVSTTRTDTECSFVEGEFKYIQDKRCREMLRTAHKAISLLELWNFVSKPIESFTWSNDNRVTAIYDKIEELGYTGHSGASFGYTLREMQFIAKYGEREFRSQYLKR